MRGRRRRHRLGLRISPVSTAGDLRDRYPQTLFNHVVKGLNPVDLAYVNVVEGETGDTLIHDSVRLFRAPQLFRRRLDGQQWL